MSIVSRSFTSSLCGFLTPLARSLTSVLIGHLRLFCWLPFFVYFLSRHPRRTLFVALFWFHILSRSRIWINLIKQLCSFSLGQHSRYRVIKTCELDSNKTFMLVGHPHGLLCEGIIYPLFFDDRAMAREFPALKYCAVGGSQLGWMPIYRELFECGDLNAGNRKLCPPDKKSIMKVLHDERRSIGIFPGGFSEAVFSNASNKVEYSYIKGRSGFLKLAIECGVDVVPVYSFGVSNLYHTPQWLRGLRSRLAQALRLPMIPYFYGKFGSLLPLGDFTVYTVIGKPFPTSTKYSLSDLDSAHTDYCRELTSMYEANKRQFGEDRDLIFIGKDFQDNKTEIPSAFKRILNISNQIGIENIKSIENWKSRQKRFKEIENSAMDKLMQSSTSVAEWAISPHNLLVNPPNSNIIIDYTKAEWN